MGNPIERRAHPVTHAIRRSALAREEAFMGHLLRAPARAHTDASRKAPTIGRLAAWGIRSSGVRIR
ncbi:hypothetical protein ACF3M1_17170 [Luteimonas sp. WGS1318]|uniref:hypothetical protein n=1 Tax=Luteimonas sp. WGS1318 TaxID=3366815 RepID=UPI00372D0E96